MCLGGREGGEKEEEKKQEMVRERWEEERKERREGRGKKEEKGEERKVRFLHACSEHDFELQSTRLPLICHWMWGEPQGWRVSHEGLCGPQYSQPLRVIV